MTIPHNKPLESIAVIEELWNDLGDNAEYHKTVWLGSKELVNADPELKKLRDYIRDTRIYGFGNRSLYHLYHLLIKEMPQNFKAIELGVFCGQVISIFSLLNKRYNKEGQIFGLTPLKKYDDNFSNFPDIDYEEAIQKMYAVSNLDASDLELIIGLSQDSICITECEKNAPYDLMLIDASHNELDLEKDILNYVFSMTKQGSYVLFDDAGIPYCKNFPKGIVRLDFMGMSSVSFEVQKHMSIDDRFKMCFTFGHNVLYRRVK